MMGLEDVLLAAAPLVVLAGVLYLAATWRPRPRHRPRSRRHQ